MAQSKEPIIPCLWFDRQAEEAVEFYCNLFGNAEIEAKSRYGKEGFEFHGMPEGTLLTARFKLHGQEFLAMNGGPAYTFTPGISLFIICETLEEADRVWGALAEGAKVMMPYDQYAWSEKYGWLNDRFGVSWQISLGKIADVGQKITPSLMLVGEKFGRA